VFVEALWAVDRKQKLNSLPLADQRITLTQQILSGSYDTSLVEISFTADGEVIQQKFYVAQIKMESNGAKGRVVFLD
jgi:branched-chain amino acid transport system substrate-binding protein